MVDGCSIPSNINGNDNHNNNSSNWTLDISMKRSIQSNCKRFLFSTTNNNNNIVVKISEYVDIEMNR
ncbi:unnamed protein product [Schistosoma curassoni]|uniref:Uncharacterized protein n=1 Tax=Schistosoma curassoni TaxID=6186 RepID=A0A183K566_9TREM|nr:unnamed protein product [Schistosoma curassoni]